MLGPILAGLILIGVIAVAHFTGVIGIVVLYIIGFVFTYWTFSRLNGMVSPGLVLIRSLVWPVYWATGWPTGERIPMD